MDTSAKSVTSAKSAKSANKAGLLYPNIFRTREIADSDLRRVNPDALDHSDPDRLPAPDFSRTHALRLPGTLLVVGEPESGAWAEWPAVEEALGRFLAVAHAAPEGAAARLPFLPAPAYVVVLFCPEEAAPLRAAGAWVVGMAAVGVAGGGAWGGVPLLLHETWESAQGAAPGQISAVLPLGRADHVARTLLRLICAVRIAPGAEYRLPVTPPAAVP